MKTIWTIALATTGVVLAMAATLPKAVERAALTNFTQEDSQMTQYGVQSPEHQKDGKAGPTPGSPKRKDKVIKTDEEWQKVLTPEQFRILRKQGTEPAFCGLFHDSKDIGTYACAGCKLDLFTSDAKFHSGTGWPSFFQPVAKDVIWARRDVSHGMIRDEVLCARCDGHLGHVFPDGPKPTGLRFCINSDALVFRKKTDE